MNYIPIDVSMLYRSRISFKMTYKTKDNEIITKSFIIIEDMIEIDKT